MAGRLLLRPKKDVAGLVDEAPTESRELEAERSDGRAGVGGRVELTWPGAELVGRGSEERETKKIVGVTNYGDNVVEQRSP